MVQWVSSDGGLQGVQYGQYNPALSADTPEGMKLSGWEYSVDSIPSTYGREDMCGFPADTVGWLDPGFM